MTTTATIQGRNFEVEVNTEAEAIFETTLSVYREVILKGVRGAYYTSERNLGTNVFRFYTETPGRRSRLPSIMFDGDYFTIEAGELREATYPEVKAAREAAKAFRAL